MENVKCGEAVLNSSAVKAERWRKWELESPDEKQKKRKAMEGKDMYIYLQLRHKRSGSKHAGRGNTCLV